MTSPKHQRAEKKTKTDLLKRRSTNTTQILWMLEKERAPKQSNPWIVKSF